MSSKRFIKEKVGWKCQICGDKHGKTYGPKVVVELQTHHAKPRSEGGETKVGNLVALCDLCHAVVTPQRWEEYFGLTKNNFPISEMEEFRKVYEDAILKLADFNKRFIENKK